MNAKLRSQRDWHNLLCQPEEIMSMIFLKTEARKFSFLHFVHNINIIRFIIFIFLLCIKRTKVWVLNEDTVTKCASNEAKITYSKLKWHDRFLSNLTSSEISEAVYFGASQLINCNRIGCCRLGTNNPRYTSQCYSLFCWVNKEL